MRLGVNGGEALERFLEVGIELRNVVNRGESRAGRSVRILGRQFGSRPSLFRAVRGKIKDFLPQFRRRTGGMRLRLEEHDGARLVPAGEVVKLLVLPERGYGGGYIRLDVTIEHHHAIAARFTNQARPPLVKFRKRPAFPGLRPQRQSQHGTQCQGENDLPSKPLWHPHPPSLKNVEHSVLAHLKTGGLGL